MPRIRNWKDLVFFRPDKETKYQHVDALFTEVIDWKLIETHWRDLMQVTLSITPAQDLRTNLQTPRTCLKTP
jgi:TnpA family transposase